MSEIVRGPWPRPQFTETEMIKLLKAIGVSLRNIELRLVRLENAKKKDEPEGSS